MRRARYLPLAAIPFIALGFFVRPARGQPVQSRVLDGVSVDREGTDYVVHIRFSLPIVYLRHAPHDRGPAVEIQLAPLAIPVDAGAGVRRESVQVPRDLPVPLESVAVEIDGSGAPVVEVRFARTLPYQVSTGEDFRSLALRIPMRAARGGASARAPARQPPPSDLEPLPAPAPGPERTDRSAALMAEGRRAMTAGEYERAAALFTAVLELPASPDAADAQELLALSRERQGQLAHAKAEYEEYLRRHPDGEGAERVRQRLDALVTAREQPAEPRRERPPEQRPLDLETFGSLYVGYRRGAFVTAQTAEEVFDSSVFTDAFFDTRLRTDSWTFRSQMSAGYTYEFADSDSETRVSSLFLEAERPEQGLTGSIGRRSRSTGGVLGRYDGVQLSWRFAEPWMVTAIAGRPVDSTTGGLGDLDRWLGGLSVDVDLLDDILDLEVFAVGQAAGSWVDRIAVGSELHYFDSGRSAAAYVDFDVYYQALNTAQLVGSWQVTPSTSLNALADYRNVPTLTTTNALIGQPAGDLASLGDLFSREEIEELAKDRTARSTSFFLGASHLLTRQLQLALDLGASDLSGTEGSGGIEAFDGTGWDFSYSGRVIASDITTTGDVGVLGFRYFDGSNLDIASLMLTGRYPATLNLRLTPRLQTDYRFQAAGDYVLLRPSFRFDYRVWKVVFDAEAGLDWRLPVDSGLDEELDYFLTFGVRYDL
jgi:hypothetical protein